MPDPAQDGVHAIGPDGKHYLFPAGTSPDAVRAHFKPASSATPAAPAALPPPPGFTSRFAEGMGIPTSTEQLKSSLPDPQDLGNPGLLAGKTATKAALGYGKQVYKGAKEGLQEGVDAAKNIAAGQPIAPNLGKAAYGAAHAAMQAVPGLGTATETAGEDIHNKNYSGAAGGVLAATIQALMLKGSKPSVKSQINKLTFAGGESGAFPKALREVLSDIKEHIESAGGGTPKTIGEFQQAVKGTSAGLQKEFEGALYRSAHRRVLPDSIADALEAKAKDMPPSAEGKQMAQQLMNASTEYRRPWTLRELDAERRMRSGMVNGYYNKAGSGQAAAMRSGIDTIIDKTIYDGTRDVLYDELDKANPGKDFQKLKLKQSHMKNLQDELDSHIDKLDYQQSAGAGKSFIDKASTSVSASPHGILTRAHNLVPKRGPMSSANAATRGAFSTGTSVPVRAGILALPVSALGRDQKKLDPPPTQGDGEQQ